MSWNDKFSRIKFIKSLKSHFHKDLIISPKRILCKIFLQSKSYKNWKKQCLQHPFSKITPVKSGVTEHVFEKCGKQEKGQECGLGITNFNDIKVGDIIEGYKEVEVEVKL